MGAWLSKANYATLPLGADFLLTPVQRNRFLVEAEENRNEARENI
jgi:hypothetical protein